MFELFTDMARRVVIVAQEEARQAGHDWIGSEHMIIGLSISHNAMDNVAYFALRETELTPESLRAELTLGKHPGGISGHIPFTPRAKQVLERSYTQSLELGQGFIGTGHLLLGWLQEITQEKIDFLESKGTNPSQIRARVLELFAIQGSRAAAESLSPEKVLGTPQASTYRITITAEERERFLVWWNSVAGIELVGVPGADSKLSAVADAIKNAEPIE